MAGGLVPSMRNEVDVFSDLPMTNLPELVLMWQFFVEQQPAKFGFGNLCKALSKHLVKLPHREKRMQSICTSNF